MAKVTTPLVGGQASSRMAGVEGRSLLVANYLGSEVSPGLAL